MEASSFYEAHFAWLALGLALAALELAFPGVFLIWLGGGWATANGSPRVRTRNRGPA